MLRKLFNFFLALALIVFSGNSLRSPLLIKAENTYQVKVYFFYEPGCSDCRKEETFLTSFQTKNPYLEITSLNVNQSETYSLLEKVWDVFQTPEIGRSTPFTVVGGKSFSGFSLPIEAQLKATFNKYHQNEHSNIFPKIQANEEILPEDFDHSSSSIFTLPLFGEVNVQEASLTAISIVLGFIDGINPCAMWVLVFLISMVLTSNDKKRIWAIGGSFLFISSLFYFVLMMAWLEAVSFLAAKKVFQIIIGSVALLAGGYNLYAYLKAKIRKDDGCEVTSVSQKKSIAEKAKKVAMQASLPLAMVGAAGLSILVNAVELACSAGLPVIFSQILALNGLSGLSALGYVLIYIFFFMLDDLIVFTLAVWTLKVKPFSAKLSRYSHLIGGILMALIGILMIFFPEFLYFSFF